ncbi:MAG: DUF1566 domain-containing protein [Verrucomicrobia bacterium]|nr:DUF1566 domain-containing protein [Verrucomicrobiota bacterium]MBU4247986.1 DUF1566 domain-containing protein [Verrucomicrobiota bacterium]MBU4291858.1 DUF1566 domain-containing protein [Verrucomicrobiota bacterium]MBU4497408.1 DUF1566 domain-containing protein [Verrucomicrobiota bacterium]MCG2681885.1 DUF1566 domain-containing protein [Kiritimatiellia bacterium]
MICRNGLVFITAIFLGLIVPPAHGGSLDAPAAPTSSNSAMWTLNDIYNKLDTRANVFQRAGAFVEPTGGPTNGTMHTLDDIMSLVTTRASVAKTEPAATYGVAWPNPRFSVVGAPGTAETNQIRDNLTGLIWARNANIAGDVLWLYAVTNVLANTFNGANYGGTNDWRMPNVLELQSLVALKYGAPVALSDGTGLNQWTEVLGPFTGVVGGRYYSSTAIAGSATQVLGMYLDNGRVYVTNKTDAGKLWPVRGGR